MSLTLRISSEHEQQEWAFSDTHVEALNMMDDPGCKQALELLMGRDDRPFGASWQVRRDELAAGLNALQAARAQGGAGYQVRAAPVPGQAEMVGRSLSGLKLGGVFCCADCMEDYWLLWRTEQLLPSGLIDCPKRYDTAELVTENIGVVRIERRKMGRREVVRLLDDVLAFVRRQQTELLTMTLG